MPIIIYGARQYTFVRERGQFQCPSCVDSTPFEWKTTFNAVHIYYIPIIPYRFETFVECGVCKRTFLERVLAEDPGRDPTFPAKRHAAALDALVAMMLADGGPSPTVMNTIKRACAKLTSVAVTDDHILARVSARDAGQSLDDSLAAVARRLSRHEREELMRAAIHVALADGHVSDAETTLLFGFADILLIHDGRAKVLWEEVERQRSA